MYTVSSPRALMMPAAAANMRGRFTRGLAVVGVAAALTWPAVLNGGPLLFPDSLGYLRQGSGIVSKLGGRDVPYWSYQIMRSEIYSASLSFLHQGPNLWPLILLQALLTAWVLWLVVRSLALRFPVSAYLAIAACLTAVTSIAWYVAAPMPDILGSLAYLSLFLLIAAFRSLRGWEAGALMVLALWCITAHATHLLLSAGVCLIFIVLWVVKWPGMAQCGRQILLAVCVLVIAVGSQLLVHRRLYHEASLYGRPPAFLMARLIGDGPGRLYLQQHCPGSSWLVCKDAANLPTDGEVFLWVKGVGMTTNPDEQKELHREEWPLLLGTLRTYPREQLAASLHNFAQTLVTMGPWDYWSYAAFTPAYLDLSVPGLSQRYPRTLQARNALPQRFWRDLQPWMVGASLLVVLALLPRAWRRRAYPLLSLSGLILFTVVANALLSGVLAGVFARYQGRVAWMVPFLAGVMIAASLNTSRERMV